MGFGWTAMKIVSKVRLLRTYRIPLCLIFLNVRLAFHHRWFVCPTSSEMVLLHASARAGVLILALMMLRTDAVSVAF